MALYIALYIADCARQHDNLELLLESTLSICCFRYVADDIDDLDALNQKIFRQLVKETQILPSTTRVDGKLAIRPCWIGASSHMEHAEALVQAVLRIGDALV